MKLTLLARAYCHLCDEMLAAVQPIAHAHGATVDVIDVDTNASLEAEWGERVPALFAGEPGVNALLCHYHLDAARVTWALKAAADVRVVDRNPL